MSKNRLRPGDEVVVICGNDRGKTGKVMRFVGEKILIEGVNVRKKHMKPTQQNQQGQIIDIECPINRSNVKPFIDGAAHKLRARINKKGEKELYYLKENKAVVHRTV